MQKKPYTPPQVTDLGDAIEQTKGFGGDYYETYGAAWDPPIDPTMGGGGDDDDGEG